MQKNEALRLRSLTLLPQTYKPPKDYSLSLVLFGITIHLLGLVVNTSKVVIMDSQGGYNEM